MPNRDIEKANWEWKEVKEEEKAREEKREKKGGTCCTR